MEYVTSEMVRDILVIGFPSAAIVDPIAVDTMAEQIISNIEHEDCRRLILDFTGVTFISSGLVGSLIGIRRYCQLRGISVKLAGLSSSFRDVLELTDLRTQFKTYRSRKSAIEMFAADDFMIRHRFFETYDVPDESESYAAPAAVAPLRLTLESETNSFGFGF